MHKNTKDLAGLRFGRLKAVRQVDNLGSKVAWEFLCDCGNLKSAISSNVVSGKTKSCGCLRVKHGNSSRPEWHVWYSMIDRCTNPKHAFWDRYGGRGISVCFDWLEFECFISDMGERPSISHQLDRIDNDQGYNKYNCRWVLSAENVRNRSDSKYWFVAGVRYESMRDAAKSVGVAHSTIKNWCNKEINGCYCERKYNGKK